MVAANNISEVMNLAGQAKINVLMHYVRESSFRYVDSSSLFTKIEQKVLVGRPEVKAQVNIIGQQIKDNVFESIMEMRVRVSVNGSDIYTADFNYCTVISLDDANSYGPQEKQYITTVKAAYLMFPFARRVLFDMTRDSGATPISLDPINFEQMYIDSQNRAAAANSSEEAKNVEENPVDPSLNLH